MASRLQKKNTSRAAKGPNMKENIPRKLPESIITGPNKKMKESKELSKWSNFSNNDRLQFTYHLTLSLESKSKQQNHGIFGYKRSQASTATGLSNFYESRNISAQLPSTPVSKLKKMNFIYCSGEDKLQQKLPHSKQNSFSGIMHIDKNYSHVKEGFTIPEEQLKPSKKMFKNRHCSNQFEQHEIESLKKQLATPLGSFINSQGVRSRENTPSRNPILNGDIQVSSIAKKHVAERSLDSERFNNRFTPQLHYFTPRQDISHQKTEYLRMKFNSSVLKSKQDESSVIDSMLNDSKAWKNDSKALFCNVKRKIQAKWCETSVQGIIREHEDHRNKSARQEMISPFKITNPKFHKMATSASKNESYASYQSIKNQQWSSNIFA